MGSAGRVAIRQQKRQEAENEVHGPEAVRLVHLRSIFYNCSSYLWLVGNGGMGYNYNYYYYHSSVPY